LTSLRESPLVQELFREGQLEGKLEGQLELVLRQLTRRVGTLDESLVRIEKPSVSKTPGF